jgi:two-component SAPR family response regulator
LSNVRGKNILILEDEVLLALEAADALKEIEAIVIGPLHRIELAMKVLDRERPDAALLDVNINGTHSTEVAQRLASEGVPFILATGYGEQYGVPGAASVIDKPYSRQQLQSAVLQLFDPSQA